MPSIVDRATNYLRNRDFRADAVAAGCAWLPICPASDDASGEVVRQLALANEDQCLMRGFVVVATGAEGAEIYWRET